MNNFYDVFYCFFFSFWSIGDILEDKDVLVRFLGELISSRETRQLGRLDQIIWKSLQQVELLAQLYACDVFWHFVARPFLLKVKSGTVDVLTVGIAVRGTHEYLSSADMESLLRQPVQLFPDIECVECLQLGLDEDIMARSKVLFSAGCLSAAEGLKSISKEYFAGGRFYTITPFQLLPLFQLGETTLKYLPTHLVLKHLTGTSQYVDTQGRP